MNTLPEHNIDASEAKFLNLIAQVPVAITTFRGPAFIVETVNKASLDIWGKSYEQVINKPLLESSPELEVAIKTLYSNVYITGEPLVINEIAVQLKRTGKPDTAYFNSVLQPLRDIDNKIYGTISVATEVTEAVNARKKIEESEVFNRTVLESSPDCVKVLDTGGRIQYMNINGLCRLEIDDFSTVKNKNWWTLWGSENEALVQASVEKALTGETAQFTAFCATAKGTPKWWDVVVSPVGKPGEPVRQLISVSRDVTEQKGFTDALEEKVNQRTEELKIKNLALELTNAELASFSFVASHDLKEPLRKIQTFSRLITDTEKFSDTTQGYFNRIISAVARMQNLIDSLLNLSRANATELVFVSVLDIEGMR